MDEEALKTCQITASEWKCPIESCSQILSRKQTLENHLSNLHQIKLCRVKRRYKAYDIDDSIPVPKATKWRHNSNMISVLKEQRESLYNTTSAAAAAGVSERIECLDVHDMDIDTEESDSINSVVYDPEHSSYCPEVNLNSAPCSETCPDVSTQPDNHQLADNMPVIQDSPLYTLPSSSSIYESGITTNEHILATTAYAARYSLSDMAIKDLLKFIQMHLPADNTAEKSLYELKKKCGFNSDYVKFQLYCDCCKKLFSDDEDMCQTPGCNGRKSDPESRKYFATSNLKIQLEEIVLRNGIWEKICDMKETSASHESLSDIRFGMSYKELQQPGFFLYGTNNITLSMFTGGVPLFQSSGVQIWPVYLLINELPAKERFTRKNMMLWGIWQGMGKPKMNMFLKPLVLDLLDLYTAGLSVEILGQQTTVKAMLVVATMDLQARAYVTNMTQHNGQYGCLYCEEPGEVVASGAGSCRAYPVRAENPPLRTDESVRENATRAQEDGQRHFGFNGLSVFNYLPYFSLVKNISVDYMHGTLLGVTKKLMFLWFDDKNKTEDYYIGDRMAEIDKILKAICPPHVIHRLPRILTNNYNNWKASELRNWLLFYSVPCLKEKLKTVYLKHYSCLVEVIYILLSEGITASQMKRADKLITFFMSAASDLYGPNIMSLNMHNLLHMLDNVRRWGPIWCWSCFPFESFNGEMKKNIHGTGNVCRQVFWNFQAIRVMQSEQNIGEGVVKDFARSMFEGKGQRSLGEEAYQCRTIKCSVLESNFEPFVKEQLQDLNGDHVVKEEYFMNVSKVIRNGFYLYSTSCSKVKKQNSCTVALESKTTDGEVAIEIEQFLLHSISKQVFAVGKLMKEMESILEGYISHMKRLDYSRRIVVKCTSLKEPMMIVKNQEALYGSLFPNHLERD